MNGERARILIIGGGIAGVATAWFLAQRGARDVVVIERENALGRHATAQNAAILRTPMPDELTEELARESADFLRDPPAGFTRTPLIAQCGIVIATLRGTRAADWERRLSARSSGGEVELLTPERARAVAPHFRADAERAWFLPREGRIDIAGLVDGFERGARAGGVRFELGQRVQSLVSEAGSVSGVRCDDGRTWLAERTVLATGGWAARMAREAGSRVELRPTRRHLHVTAPDPRVDPGWPVTWTDAGPFYARPEGGGWMLCACDEVDVDPDALTVVPAVREAALAQAERHLRTRVGPIAREWAGIRTLTADSRFVIGADCDLRGLYWVAGLGGHGMTCSPSIGRIAADALLDAQRPHPAVRALAPARFVAARART